MINDGDPFPSSEAGRFGFSRRTLTPAVDAGALRRVLRGVYVDARVEDSRLLRARALALVRPVGTAVCLRTAAWFWGVDCDPLGVAPGRVPMDLVSIHGNRVRRPGTAGRRWILEAGDLSVVGGILVTSTSRTALDCARLLDRGAAMASLDGFARERLIPSIDDLAQRAERLQGARGVRQARGLIPLIDAGAESGMESRTRLAAIDAGFPRPETQIPVVVNDELFRLDWGYRSLRVAVEYDGRQFHDDARADRDLRRRGLVRQAGWEIVVVDRDRFCDPTLEWLTELRRLVTDRAHGRAWSA